MRPIRILLISLGLLVLMGGKPFSKPAKSLKKYDLDSREIPLRFDTLAAPAPDTIAVAGFEKTLRSSRETMYVTNHSTLPIMGIALEITYSDTDGRMLHKALHNVDADIPSGETRMISVPSFDRQAVFYYYLSPRPVRSPSATPFKAAVRILYCLIPKPDSQ